MMNTEMSAIKYLSNLSEGETGEIIQVRGKPEIHRYLYGKGLAMGRIISVDNSGVICRKYLLYHTFRRQDNDHRERNSAVISRCGLPGKPGYALTFKIIRPAIIFQMPA